MIKKTQSQITYDQLAPFYRQISLERNNYLSSVDNIITPYLLGNKTLIDLGSGDGIRISQLAKKVNVHEVILIDNSNEMVKLSKKIPKVKVVKSSIVSYLPKKKFDVVTCLWNVLGHMDQVDDIKKVILNIDANILKKGGMLLLDVNNRYNILAYGLGQVIINIIRDLFGINKRYVEFYKKMDRRHVKMKVHFFNPYEIENYLKDTTLKITKKYYINYNTGKIESVFWRGQILYIIKKL